MENQPYSPKCLMRLWVIYERCKVRITLVDIQGGTWVSPSSQCDNMYSAVPL